jgi:multiple sugar transport system permease protein
MYSVNNKRRIVFRKNLYFYMLTLPTVLILFGMTIYPLIYSFTISMTKYNLSSFSEKQVFIGLSNYAQLFADQFFGVSFWNTIKYVFGAVVIEFIIGFGIALLLFRLKRFGKPLLTLFLLPMMLTPIIVGLMWRFMFNYDVGLVNYIIELIGFQRFPFLAEKSTSLLSIILVDAWQWTPFVILLLYSGLQTVPIESFEAAKIDGASELQLIRYITLPALKHTIFICLLIRGMDALREYDKVYTMTYGGPGNATETVSFYIYRQGFKFFNIGYAAAGSYLLLILTIGVAQYFLSKLHEA